MIISSLPLLASYIFTAPLPPSSIRAFRASVRNDDYVRDVIDTRKKREAEEAAERERERERAKINPFSVSCFEWCMFMSYERAIEQVIVPTSL
jgi:hypothetical protein